MSDHRVRIDRNRQQARYRGQVLELQPKAVQVLAMLHERAPKIVSRQELIEFIWGGNHLTGEKGLHQAMWSIRSALGDDSRDARFVRTIPRNGYQWIHRPNMAKRLIRKRRVLGGIAATLTVVTVFAVTNASKPGEQFALPSRCTISSDADVHAYRVERQLRIDIHEICRLIFVPSSGAKRLGDPFVSDDGTSVAFTVTENQKCRLVMFDLENGERAEFDTCEVTSAVTQSLSRNEGA